jgi:hypothetical protein
MEPDEELQARLLAYITEPSASSCSRAWRDYLYDALHIRQESCFKKQIRESGKIDYVYSALRPISEDLEESVHYNFAFGDGGTYTMQWVRTFDAWSSQSEQHFGRWRVFLGQLMCETVDPLEEPRDAQVRFAPAGWKFSMPLEDILSTGGAYKEAPVGAPPAPWESLARLGKEQEGAQSNWTKGQWENTEPTDPTPIARVAVREGSRFVEIDGDMHEVAGDIVANWPEHEWKRLMQVRLRFGIF